MHDEDLSLVRWSLVLFCLAGSLVSLMVTKLHVCYQLGGVDLDWVRSLLMEMAVLALYLTIPMSPTALPRGVK